MGNLERSRCQGIHFQERQHVSQHCRQLPKPDIHRLDPPASPVNKSPVLAEIEGQRVKITGRFEPYKGKPEIRINAAEQLEVQ